MNIRAFEIADESAVIEIWRRCGLVRPTNDPVKDIRRKLMVQAELFLVAVMDGKIVGTVMAGYEGHRGWINYLAADLDYQRRGIGRALINAAEERLKAAGCPKINLQVRTSNRAVLEFYRAIGFMEDDVVSLGKRLVVD